MKRNIQSIAQFSADSAFTENQVRWWIFNAAKNGLADSAAIVRMGRRVYIDIDAFDRWIDAQQTKQVAA